MIALAIVVFAFAFIFLLSNIFITTTQITVKSDSLPKEFEGYKILHLSDLHLKNFGHNYKRLLDKIKPLEFDIVVFTGDLISRHEHDISEKIFFMKELIKKAPVYFIYGNHEVENPLTTDKMCKELVKIGVNILDNKTYQVEKGGEKVDICGITIEKKFYKNKDKTYKDLPTPNAEYINERLGKKKNFTLFLSHTPFYFDEYAKWGADLTLCGHVHGGAIRLPFINGLLSPERKFFPKYSAGLYKKGDCQMYVSRGLGKPRIFNNSQITIITLDK
ncbi:MAG: metallophosphoesterase [Clostridiales bacterium]|nr:metallophosphoesterase [Clostridiales bacterium]